MVGKIVQLFKEPEFTMRHKINTRMNKWLIKINENIMKERKRKSGGTNLAFGTKLDIVPN